MPQLRYTFFPVLFLFFLAGPAHAGLLDRMCTIVLARLGALSGKTDSTPWLKDLKITTKLQALLAKHLEEITPGAEKYLGALPKGSVLEVNGTQYKVVAYLGGEYEGSVYLADGPEGRRSIKQFNGKTEILDHYKQLSRIAKLGIRTPRVWDVDSRSKAAAMEYVEGVPVNVLLNKGQKYGLTQKDLSAIKTQYGLFKSRMLGLGQKIKDGNVIMDLNTGEFVLVDPI